MAYLIENLQSALEHELGKLIVANMAQAFEIERLRALVPEDQRQAKPHVHAHNGQPVP